MQRPDITDHLAPASFGFFCVAPHRVGLGQSTDRPAFAPGFNHRQRFGFRDVEHGNGVLDVHAGMQHVPLVMKDATKTFCRIDVGRMRIRHHHQPHIMPGLIDRDHLGLRAQRKFGAEFRNRHVGVYGCHIWPHQAPYREIADPAHIGGTADGLAAQVQSPCRERVAEQFARDLGRDDHRDQHDSRQPEVAGRFQRDERHRQRPADHGRRQRAHANDRIDVRIEVEPRRDRVDAGREQTAADRAQKKRGKKQAAAKSTSQRYHRRDRLQGEHQGDERQRHGDDPGKLQRAVPRRHHLRRPQCE
jgi:hypothetical protein